jgi:hypothetical protein
MYFCSNHRLIDKIKIFSDILHTIEMVEENIFGKIYPSKNSRRNIIIFKTVNKKLRMRRVGYD